MEGLPMIWRVIIYKKITRSVRNYGNPIVVLLAIALNNCVVTRILSDLRKMMITGCLAEFKSYDLSKLVIFYLNLKLKNHKWFL